MKSSQISCVLNVSYSMVMAGCGGAEEASGPLDWRERQTGGPPEPQAEDRVPGQNQKGEHQTAGGEGLMLALRPSLVCFISWVMCYQCSMKCKTGFIQKICLLWNAPFVIFFQLLLKCFSRTLSLSLFAQENEKLKSELFSMKEYIVENGKKLWGAIAALTLALTWSHPTGCFMETWRVQGIRPNSLITHS